MSSIENYRRYCDNEQYRDYIDNVMKWNFVFYDGEPYLVIGDKKLVEESFEDNYDTYYTNNGMICGTNNNKKWREFVEDEETNETIILTYDEIVKTFGEHIAEIIYYRGDTDEFEW